jgi:indole-3-glycerol phosphate synthase
MNDSQLFLEKIITKKRIEVENLYQNIGIDSYKKKHPLKEAAPKKNLFYKAISKPGLSLIAEVKKASPSKGIIRKDFDPIKLACAFEENGAAAISVLTEKDFFLGSPEYLTEIKKNVELPLLRKDFIIDPIQVYEAKDIGADAILLIKAILDQKQCQALINLANALELDVLLEIHNEDELAEIIELTGLFMVGINNRNLKSFEVDTNVASIIYKKARNHFPEKTCFVAESGYKFPDDMARLSDEGFDGVLIGEGTRKISAA